MCHGVRSRFGSVAYILFVALPTLFGTNVAAIYGGGVCWGWQELLIDYSAVI